MPKVFHHPKPVKCFRENLFKEDWWRLKDLSVNVSGDIGLSGGNYHNCKTFIVLYSEKELYSKDKPNPFYYKIFSSWSNWPYRCISFLQNQSHQLVSCIYNLIEIFDFKRDTIIKRLTLEDSACVWCVCVRGDNIIVGLRSFRVNILNSHLQVLNSIKLDAIKYEDCPWDIAATSGNLYLCTFYGMSIAVEESNDANFMGLGTHKSSYADSISVSEKLRLVAILSKNEDIDLYSLVDQQSLARLHLKNASKVRTSDSGCMVIANERTGEVKIYDLQRFTPFDAVEGVISVMQREDCKKLANIFDISEEQLDDVLKSDTPVTKFLDILNETGQLTPSNVDVLSSAEISVSASFLQTLNEYQMSRSYQNVSPSFAMDRVQGDVAAAAPIGPVEQSSTGNTEEKIAMDETQVRNCSMILKQHIAKKWKDFARCLQVPENKIDQISEDFRDDVEERILQMLLYWYRQNPSGATLQKLEQALQDIQRADVAYTLPLALKSY